MLALLLRDHLLLEVTVEVAAAVEVTVEVVAAVIVEVAVLVVPERMMVSKLCYSRLLSVAWAMSFSFSRAIRDAFLCSRLDFP